VIYNFTMSSEDFQDETSPDSDRSGTGTEDTMTNLLARNSTLLRFGHTMTEMGLGRYVFGI